MTVLLLAGIAALQTLLNYTTQRIPALQAQTALIEAQGIDPSALFYTESDLALRAEKTVRKQLP